MSTVVENSKLVGESLLLRFNLESRMVVGETVATAVCGIEVEMGEDEDTSGLLSGAATIETPFDVSQRMVGGSVGKIYKVTCAVRTTLNNILYNQAKIAVLPSTELVPDPL